MNGAAEGARRGRAQLPTPHGTVVYWIQRAGEESSAAERVGGAASSSVPGGASSSSVLDRSEHAVASAAAGRDDSCDLELVFLPGLTADHRLFQRQWPFFAGRYTCLVWDAPGHGESRPFDLDISLDDWARMLQRIIEKEGLHNPVLIGQSMGGYVSQMHMELFPGVARGFVSIDSAPLQRSYYRNWELASLKHTRGMYLSIPWSLLRKWGAAGTAESSWGRQVMAEMLSSYGKSEYCDLAGRGFRILAEAVETDRSFKIACPALLLCGEKDAAGFTKRYNGAWARKTGLPIHWIPGAGHNANCDEPELVNELIDEFLGTLG